MYTAQPCPRLPRAQARSLWDCLYDAASSRACSEREAWRHGLCRPLSICQSGLSLPQAIQLVGFSTA